jgi:hypothetical protein
MFADLNAPPSRYGGRRSLESCVPRSDDSNPDKWEYYPHAKAKHDMLAYYLDG